MTLGEQVRNLVKIAAAVICALVAVGFMTYSVVSSYTANKRNSVGIASEIFSEKCSSQYPIFLSVTNYHERVLKNVGIELTMYNAGVSEPIWQHSFEWNRIVRPNKTETNCLSILPETWEKMSKKGVILRAELNWQDPVFYGEREFIPAH